MDPNVDMVHREADFEVADMHRKILFSYRWAVLSERVIRRGAGLLCLLSVNLCLLANHAPAEKPEGFGGQTEGGAGGMVIIVDTLEDVDRKGSIRWAVNQKGKRIVRFSVSGICRLEKELVITEPGITIDGSLGQKKATNGVTFRDYPIAVRTHDVILRYLRVRLGDVAVLDKVNRAGLPRPGGSKNLDCISIDRSKNVLVDHVSASWCTDEVISITRSENVTVQWCIISEPLANPRAHPYGDKHAYGANNSASTATYHHNLFADYVMRGPQLEANDARNDQGYDVRFEVVNNVMYQYKRSGARYSPGFESEADRVENVRFLYHFINNYFVHPDDEERPEIEVIAKYRPVANVKAYIKGNWGRHRPGGHGDELAVVFTDLHARQNVRRSPEYMAQISPVPLFCSTIPVEAENPQKAFWSILKKAGCVGENLNRDKIDRRVITAIEMKRPMKILGSQNDVEGWRVEKHF
jgi:hypothetical protein